MEKEFHQYATELTGIHINLADQAIEFEDRHGTVGRLRFSGETVLYEGQPLLLAPPLGPDPVTATDGNALRKHTRRRNAAPRTLVLHAATHRLKTTGGEAQ